MVCAPLIWRICVLLTHLFLVVCCVYNFIAAFHIFAKSAGFILVSGNLTSSLRVREKQKFTGKSGKVSRNKCLSLKGFRFLRVNVSYMSAFIVTLILTVNLLTLELSNVSVLDI